METKNLIKMGWGAVRGNLFNKRLPLNVMLSVTNRCPSQCSYCNIPNRKQRELGTSEIFDLIDQIARLGCQRLGLWGGEPLIRDDIDKIISYAKTKGLFVSLDSNGYFLPQKLKLINNLDHLILAFDGPQKLHDLNRGPGSFHKTMAAIEAASGILPFWTITVITKNNLDSVDFILDNARKYGFLTTFQLLHHNEQLAGNQDSLMPSAESCRDVIKQLIKEKKKGAPIASSLNYLYHILHWPDYRVRSYSYKVNKLKCWAGRLYCNVDTDGSVYPCSLLVGTVKASNFLEDGFKKAFDNLRQNYCNGCMASCFTEYNYLYSLDIGTIIEWIKAFKFKRAYSCSQIKK
jgi:MoaA/NifB/PqqE/SkfB family radical SAM enzyme